MDNTTLYPIALRQEDINLITFALRKLENNTSVPMIKEEAQNLISYIEYLNKDFKEQE